MPENQAGASRWWRRKCVNWQKNQAGGPTTSLILSTKVTEDVDSSAQATEEAVTLITAQAEIGDKALSEFRRIADGSREVSSALKKAETATREVLAYGQSIAGEINMVAASSQENAAAAQEIAASAQEMSAARRIDQLARPRAYHLNGEA